MADAFLRETVLLPTQFVGWLLLQRERRTAPELDLFALLRTTSGDRHDYAEVCDDGERLRRALIKLEDQGAVRLDPALRTAPMDQIIDDAVRTFGMYHLRNALERSGESLVVSDPKMLYFYGNRLEPWRDPLREALA